MGYSLQNTFITEKENEHHKRIFTIWNSYASRNKGFSCHKSLFSKCSVDKKSRADPPDLLHIISDALILYTPNVIVNGIENYFDIVISDGYYYDYKFKTLGLFLYSKRGLQQFIGDPFSKFEISVNNIFVNIRNDMEFLTVSFDKYKLLDIKRATYMGVDISVMNYRNVESFYYDIVSIENLEFSYFIRLEECIITLIYRKENLELLKKLVKLHLKNKERFRKIAKSYIKELEFWRI